MRKSFKEAKTTTKVQRSYRKQQPAIFFFFKYLFKIAKWVRASFTKCTEVFGASSMGKFVFSRSQLDYLKESVHVRTETTLRKEESANQEGGSREEQQKSHLQPV